MLIKHRFMSNVIVNKVIYAIVLLKRYHRLEKTGIKTVVVSLPRGL